jgi:hypothetical protein
VFCFERLLQRKGLLDLIPDGPGTSNFFSATNRRLTLCSGDVKIIADSFLLQTLFGMVGTRLISRRNLEGFSVSLDVASEAQLMSIFFW